MGAGAQAALDASRASTTSTAATSTCRPAFIEPKPLQKPYPVIMNAGTSPAGRTFAAKHSDLIFAGLTNAETAPQQIAEIKALARERYGREIRVFGRGHIVCRDTQQEAEEYYDYVHRQVADFAGAANVTGHQQAPLAEHRLDRR